MPAPSILVTKLYIPTIRLEIVHRPHLIERLDRGLQGKLTLISAPAGFGKTTLVTEWLHSKGDNKPSPFVISWLSLDERDNDPAQFLTYIIAALQMVDRHIGQKAQAVFQSQQRLLVEPINLSLINDIVQFSDHDSQNSPKEIIFVLDDYHVIEETAIHQTIDYLIEHHPPHFHLVILTRIDPPLTLSRLRARNQLLEIRGTDLHFSEQDTEMFLNEIMKLDLAPDEIAILDNRTEGWIAGLQLAAISLQGRVNRGEFIQAFSGDNRFVIDFLLDEVLLKQPEDIRQFLLQTSILDRMCGDLCDAIVDSSNEESPLSSQEFLEYLDLANLFVIPLDDKRYWYRYHHLFADVLQNRLQATLPELIPILHLRASGWFEHQEDNDQALHHAILSGNLEKAALIVEHKAIQLLSHSNLATLKKWLDSLPQDLIRSRPELCVYQGWIEFLIGTVKNAEQWIDNAKGILSSSTPRVGSQQREVYGHIDVIKAHIALKDKELHKANALAQKSLDYIPERSPLHGHVAVIQGQVAYWNGDLDAADQAMIEAVSIAQACDHLFMAVEATIWRGHIKTLQGCLQQAVELYRDALQLADIGDKNVLPIAGSAYIGMALVERERNNLAVAESLLNEGYDMCTLFGNTRSWHIAMALVRIAQGEKVEALDELQTAEKFTPGPEGPFVHLNNDHIRVRLWLSQMDRNLSAAVRWAEDSGIQVDETPAFSQREAYTLFARVLLTQGEFDKAYAMLAKLSKDSEIGGRKRDLIELLILQAVSFHIQDDADQAFVILEQVLSLAEIDGFVQIFVDEGPPMARLLYEALSSNIKSDFVQTILKAFPILVPEPGKLSHTQFPQSGLFEPLSERELEIIHLLDQGLTNQEIAARLYISRHTVKVHTRNIYGKLGVSNRSQASAKARAMGILSSD